MMKSFLIAAGLVAMLGTAHAEDTKNLQLQISPYPSLCGSTEAIVDAVTKLDYKITGKAFTDEADDKKSVLTILTKKDDGSIMVMVSVAPYEESCVLWWSKDYTPS
jgi:hypothetical protein